MAQQIRYSRQREVIRKQLQGRTDHPTAEVIYKEIHAVDPQISLGTVYRNLMLLVDLGEIQTVNVGDGSVHFDPDTSEHAHFLCSRCHCLLDFRLSDPKNVMGLFTTPFHGKVNKINISITGLCPECLEKVSETNKTTI